jgi:hypothetical protein
VTPNLWAQKPPYPPTSAHTIQIQPWFDEYPISDALAKEKMLS